LMVRISRRTQRTYQVAVGVRRWAHWARFYHIPTSGFDSRLGGMCAIASYKLFIELIARGIDSQFIKNDGHSFVSVDDMIFDVTATQFSTEFPPVAVVVGEMKDRMYEWGCATSARTIVGVKRMNWDEWGGCHPLLPVYDEIMRRPIRESNATDKVVASSITRTNHAVRIAS